MPVTTCSEQDHERGAAEHVPPARGAPRHAVRRGLADRRAEPAGAASSQSRDRADQRASASASARRSARLTCPSVGIMPPRDPELAALDLVLVLEEPAWRRARGARAVGVVGAAVARAHEEARLREPAHRTAEVRAVDREDLELRRPPSSSPSTGCRAVAVPGCVWTGCGRWPSAVCPSGNERRDVAERDPVQRRGSARGLRGREQVADDRRRQRTRRLTATRDSGAMRRA